MPVRISALFVSILALAFTGVGCAADVASEVGGAGPDSVLDAKSGSPTQVLLGDKTVFSVGCDYDTCPYEFTLLGEPLETTLIVGESRRTVMTALEDMADGYAPQSVIQVQFHPDRAGAEDTQRAWSSLPFGNFYVGLFAESAQQASSHALSIDFVSNADDLRELPYSSDYWATERREIDGVDRWILPAWQFIGPRIQVALEGDADVDITAYALCRQSTFRTSSVADFGIMDNDGSGISFNFHHWCDEEDDTAGIYFDVSGRGEYELSVYDLE